MTRLAGKSAATCCTVSMAWFWVESLTEAALIGCVDATVLAAATEHWLRVCLEEARRGQ